MMVKQPAAAAHTAESTQTAPRGARVPVVGGIKPLLTTDDADYVVPQINSDSSVSAHIYPSVVQTPRTALCYGVVHRSFNLSHRYSAATKINNTIKTVSTAVRISRRRIFRSFIFYIRSIPQPAQVVQLVRSYGLLFYLCAADSIHGAISLSSLSMRIFTSRHSLGPPFLQRA